MEHILLKKNIEWTGRKVGKIEKKTDVISTLYFTEISWEKRKKILCECLPLKHKLSFHTNCTM